MDGNHNVANETDHFDDTAIDIHFLSRSLALLLHRIVCDCIEKQDDYVKSHQWFVAHLLFMKTHRND